MALISRLCVMLVGGWLLFHGLGLCCALLLAIGPRGDDGAWMFTVLGAASWLIPGIMLCYGGYCLYALGKGSRPRDPNC